MPLAPIPLTSLERVGHELDRPEDVAVSADGRVFASHKDALAEVSPDGSIRAFGTGLGVSNGIALLADGRIVATSYTPDGGVRIVDPDSGAVDVLALEADGRPMRYANYPVVDRHGAVWISCSTAHESWLHALATGTDDGFIARIDPSGAAVVVSEGLRFANGMTLDADEAYLYCCQSAAADVVRFPVRPDGTLGPKEPYGPPLGERRPDEFTEATAMAAFADPAVQRRWGLTDGCAFDADGNLWVTVVTSSRIAAITPERDVVDVVTDPEGTTLVQPTNLAWGGPDLTDLYIGLLGTHHLLKTTTPVPGLALSHQR